MKKILTPVLSIMLASAGIANAEQTTWDFTNWSGATKTALAADTENWSNDEKGNGNEADIHGTDCYWLVGDAASNAQNKEGRLYANDVEIAELKGLDFSMCQSARNLAIAVNYPSTSLGEYHGGSYLWLGGSKKNYFVIPNVKNGTTIKMGVESHKPAEARGVELYVYSNGAKGDKIDGPEAPTTYTEQTWTIPGTSGTTDVLVYNTNGCHIYSITADVEGSGTPDQPGTEDPGVIGPGTAGQWTYVATCLNADQAPLPTSGTKCQEVSWTINEGIVYTLSTTEEAFRGTTGNKDMVINGKYYSPVYILSTGGGHNKLYDLSKTGDITKVTMYAYWNSDGDSSTTITLNPGTSTAEPVTIYGFQGAMTSVDITNYTSLEVCGSGFMAVFVIEYNGEPVEEPGDEPGDEEPGNPFMATCLNSTAALPTSGTNCKSVTWDIENAFTFNITTTEEAFRGTSGKDILVNGKYYSPVYFLSTSGTANKLFDFTKSEKITSVTMYPLYNKEDGSTATIYLNPDTDAEEAITIQDLTHAPTGVDITNCSQIKICSNGMMAVFEIAYSEGGTSAVAGLGVDENVEPVYYNLQGVRIANPTNGIFVRVQGDKVEKIVIR